LLSRDMNVIVVRGGAYGEPKSAYSQLKTALERFFDGEGLAEQLEHQPPDSGRASITSRHSLSRRRSFQSLRRTISNISGMSDIVGEDNGQRSGGYGLVIDGASLSHAFGEPYTKDLLLELATRCRAVVCCRTSPLQKALIVRLVKDGLGSMCLAIGDGANDVSMIQAADIGVGVAGEEGLQAVNSSDYAMGQFRFLKRLLLVHGSWSYLRNSNMIVNFFYKEIIGVGVLFWFQFYCGYSATTVYEYTYLLFWNVFWTLGTWPTCLCPSLNSP
jgi:phospholipid-translocating ATPase